MKTLVLFITILLCSLLSFSQQSDFIVLKKRNNRSIKTFYPGSFISAKTYNGFNINGFISDIRNDSIFIRQEETRLFGTEFGSTLDTLKYSIGIDYREIGQFNYTKNYKWGGKKGFVQVALPKIMMIGGVGFIILESVNTIYRKESFNEDGKLAALGVAAGVAVAGYLWQYMQDKSKKAGGKYKVVYIKAADIKRGF
jgi:hypothetical protein